MVILAVFAFMQNFIFGVFALYNVLIAPQQPTDELEKAKKRNCIIFSVIAIVLGIIATVLVYSGFYEAYINALNEALSGMGK